MIYLRQSFLICCLYFCTFAWNVFFMCESGCSLTSDLCRIRMFVAWRWGSCFCSECQTASCVKPYTPLHLQIVVSFGCEPSNISQRSLCSTAQMIVIPLLGLFPGIPTSLHMCNINYHSIMVEAFRHILLSVTRGAVMLSKVLFPLENNCFRTIFNQLETWLSFWGFSKVNLESYIWRMPLNTFQMEYFCPH